MISPTPLLLSYYGGLYLRSDPADILRVITLTISELAVLAVVQSLLYAAERAATDYSVGLLRFDHVEGSMIFWLATAIWNILTHFDFYRAAKPERIDPVLVALAF